MPTKRAVVVGFEYYGRFLCELMNEHSDRWELKYFGPTRWETIRAGFALRSADALISFGGPSPNVALVEAARARGIPIVIIWAGTDVIAAQRDPHLFEIIKRYGFTHLSDGPWLVKELRELDIDATYVPVTAIEAPEHLAPFPKNFNVLTYLPEPRRTFYGEKLVYAIAREFPDVAFRVVGKGAPNSGAPANVEFLGYVDDMPARIDDSTVLLRLPEHDGKSMLVLEALAHGRHVIWNYDFPCVHHVTNVAGAIAVLRRLRDLFDEGKLELNTAGCTHVREEFGRARLARGFESALDAARGRAFQQGRKIAVSGLDLFVAHVTQRLQERPIGWVPNVLRTSSRLEVFTSMLMLARCDAWYSIGAPIGDRWLHLFARLLRKPHIIHWVGTDIAQLYRDAGLRRICRNREVQHLAEVDWTIDELRALGIDAALAPLPPRVAVQQVPPLPETFTVLLYLPKTRGEFYGRREYERLFRAFADRNVRFLIVGGGECYVPPGAKVERLGWCTSLEDAYRRSSVLVRFTQHDGLSLMVLEALSRGRHVLWSNDFPFTERVRSYHDIERALETMLQLHERSELTPCTEAAHYIATTYDRDACIERIAKSWERAARGERGGAIPLGATP